MIRQPRSVTTPVLAEELCREIRALVGTSGHSVLLEVLSGRLRVGWNDLMQAVSYARHLGWVEVRRDSVALREGQRESEGTALGAGGPGGQGLLLSIG